MEFYSPNIDLKRTFGEEINDPEYIKQLNTACLNSSILYQEAQSLFACTVQSWST